MAKWEDGILYGDVGYDEETERSYYNCEWCAYSCHGSNEVTIITKADVHDKECSLNPNNKWVGYAI